VKVVSKQQINDEIVRKIIPMPMKSTDRFQFGRKEECNQAFKILEQFVLNGEQQKTGWLDSFLPMCRKKREVKEINLAITNAVWVEICSIKQELHKEVFEPV
jgi:hypothetical protein